MGDMNYFLQLSGALGAPATIALVIMWTEIKHLKNKINRFESDNSKLIQLINDIRVDVSFIKGRYTKDTKEK